MVAFLPCWKERPKNNQEDQSLFSQLTCEIAEVHTSPQMETCKKKKKKKRIILTVGITLKWKEEEFPNYHISNKMCQ